jgi:hypothetical protein
MQTKPNHPTGRPSHQKLTCHLRATNLHSLLRGAVAFSAGMVLAADLSAANLLNNPSFESSFNSWTKHGTGGNVVESQAPNHSGANVLKNWGCWCAPTNQQGVFQDVASSDGSSYTAGGWIFSRTTDYVGTLNSGFYEVIFLDAADATLAKYRSEAFTNGTPGSEWVYYNVNGQVDLGTDAIVGTVSSLVAPAGTTKARFRTIYQQVDNGGGACHYDDVELNQTGGNQPPSISGITPNGSSLFNSAAGGFSFAATSTTSTIDPSGIHVILNGLDVSASLVVAGPGNNRAVSYPAIKSNRIYSAEIRVTDVVGLSSTAAALFDTFSPGNFIWEAEDYDFEGGHYINNPIPTSTNNAALSYFGQMGYNEIDFHDPSWGGNGSQAYRSLDNPGPGTEWCADIVRQKYLDAIAGGDADVKDYDVGWTYGGLAGDWMNFTRNFPAGTYNIYGRLSGGGGVSKVGLWKVTSGVGTTTQTTESIGTFVWSSRGWQSWDWVPLNDANGNLVKITLSGATTLRAAGDNANQNFFMLVPARDDLPVISNLSHSGLHPFEPATTLSFNASSSVATIPTSGIKVMLNGMDVSSLMIIGGNATNRSVSLPVLAANAIYTATIQVVDSAGSGAIRPLKFDTFSESNFTFEAEDYDFGGGQFIDNPILTTAYDPEHSYYMQQTAAMDYVDIVPQNLAGQHYDYRNLDSAGTEVTSDYLRQAYVTAQITDPAVRDYDVGWCNAGVWYNFTRTYPAGNFWLYARLAGPGILNAHMGKVTNGVGTTNQTVAPLGDFAGLSDGWQSWVWVPCTAGGKPVTIPLSGKATLRGTTEGYVNFGYYMLVPAKTEITMTVSKVTGGVGISIPSQAGASYTLLYKDSLQDATWKLLTILQGNGSTKSYTDTSASGGQRYYRCLIQ